MRKGGSHKGSIVDSGKIDRQSGQSDIDMWPNLSGYL